MLKDIDRSISILEEENDKINHKINLLKNIDLSKPVTEEVWHEICETPLRNSDLLIILVRNTFPEAKYINIEKNFVNFKLFGFDIQIPTTRKRGINVNLNWYIKDRGTPKLEYTPTISRLKKYFECIDNHENWYKCAYYRLSYGNLKPKWFLFFSWFFKYKWKPIDREVFNKRLQVEEELYKNELESYLKEREKMKNLSSQLIYEILPIIDKFSTKHNPYNNENKVFQVTIEDIKKLEFPEE